MGQFHLGFVTMKTCFAFILFASSINFIFAKDCSEGGVSECVDSHRGRFNDECSEYQAMIDCYQGCQLSSAAKFLQKGYKKILDKADDLGYCQVKTVSFDKKDTVESEDLEIEDLDKKGCTEADVDSCIQKVGTNFMDECQEFMAKKDACFSDWGCYIRGEYSAAVAKKYKDLKDSITEPYCNYKLGPLDNDKRDVVDTEEQKIDSLVRELGLILQLKGKRHCVMGAIQSCVDGNKGDDCKEAQARVNCFKGCMGPFASDKVEAAYKDVMENAPGWCKIKHVTK